MVKGVKVWWFVMCSLLLVGAVDAASKAKGRVFYDQNENQKYDQGELLLPDVRVSNGEVIVKTNAMGQFELPYDDEETIFFVIKPAGWRTPVNDHQLPQFYHIHKPKGSPKLKYEGIAPTGKLPKSIDFPLYPQDEPDKFKAVLFADPQPRTQEEIDFVSHDVVEELVGTDATFGVTLGDIMFDRLSLFDSQNAAIALIGIPWYNVVGNHDINLDAPDDFHSNETFKSVFGPPYYSFDYGKVHFIVLDDVEWFAGEGDKRGHYKGGLDKRQMAFIKNDLALVPQEQLIVLFMHIPLVNIENREELYRLIETRPFTMSVSGHTHYQEHVFLTAEDGWQGPKPHHHVINVTVSGSWWRGATDEQGIPLTPMRDGAPNGYSIVTFDGTDYDIAFKAAGFDADYQMHIFAPDSVSVADVGSTQVVANVFGGSVRSKVEMRIGENGTWLLMTKTEMEDPYYVALKQLEETHPPKRRKLPGVMKSDHIWTASLPSELKRGTYFIYVRTTDMFGKTYMEQRVIRVQ